MNTEVEKILKQIKEIHDRKNHDYASDSNRYSNFERASTIASYFKSDTDKVFATMIGIKLARLAELLDKKEPKNESIDDSFLDLCTYCVLWMSYRRSNKQG